MDRQKRFIQIGVILTVAIFFTVGGIVFGEGLIPAADGTIYGCFVTHMNDNEPQGQLRVVSSPGECRNNETPIQWNEVGPQGIQGEQGPVGQQGPPGPQGEPGTMSYAGLTCPSGESVFGFNLDGSIICTNYTSPVEPSNEICDGIDNDLNGEIDDGFVFCIDGNPAAGTDGHKCIFPYLNLNGFVEDGCEVRPPQQSVNDLFDRCGGEIYQTKACVLFPDVWEIGSPPTTLELKGRCGVFDTAQFFSNGIEITDQLYSYCGYTDVGTIEIPTEILNLEVGTIEVVWPGWDASSGEVMVYSWEQLARPYIESISFENLEDGSTLFTVVGSNLNLWYMHMRPSDAIYYDDFYGGDIILSEDSILQMKLELSYFPSGSYDIVFWTNLFGSHFEFTPYIGMVQIP